MMTEKLNGVKTTAPLQNVSLCASALERAMRRPRHLPGLVCFYGPAGWGKSVSAVYAANRHRAYYVEARSTWTTRAMLLGILKEMGIAPGRTVYEMTDQVCEQLERSERPLIIDEMDHLVGRGCVESLRDLYEGSKAAMLIIGEEGLPSKLQRWERFHSRVLDWRAAQPVSVEDARYLEQLYCDRIDIADDLLGRIHGLARGAVRRVCVNLEAVQEWALTQGLERVGLAEWGKRELYTGDPPPRRPV
jgi:AAA domain